MNQTPSPPHMLPSLGLSQQRHLQYFWYNFTIDSNYTDAFDEQNLVKAQDVSVDAVMTSIYFNAFVFLILMGCYECLRRMLPAVYSSRKRLLFAKMGRNQKDWMEQQKIQKLLSKKNHQYVDKTTESRLKRKDERNVYIVPSTKATMEPTDSQTTAYTTTVNRTVLHDETTLENSDNHSHTSEQTLPDDRPLDWVGPVFGVPWNKVRQLAGLDGYFFLRFIRMQVRIAAISTFWFWLILVPIYTTGSNNEYRYQARGWYHLSVANIPAHGWRMWVACSFLYLFSGFIFFVVKQEYRHFLEVRQDFLARGTAYIPPQHHYSIMVENIPYDLRSDAALQDYFNKLFPGQVHSASVVLKVPDLEEAAARVVRSCRRLEKSIAFWKATGSRPTHTVGRHRLTVLGVVDLPPVECWSGLREPSNNMTTTSINNQNFNEVTIKSSQSSFSYDEMTDPIHIDNPSFYLERPKRGTRVDSISYYTQELAAHSRALLKLQKQKDAIAESGNRSINNASTWLDQVVREASLVACRILNDSVQDNALVSTTVSGSAYEGDTTGMAEHMSSTSPANSYYGSMTTTPPIRNTVYHSSHNTETEPDILMLPNGLPHIKTYDDDDIDDDEDDLSEPSQYSAPFSQAQYSNRIRRWAGRLGLDFIVAIFRYLSKQLDSAVGSVTGRTMSSTGFVTFLNLSSTTCAASAPLTVKASVLDVTVAPEPRVRFVVLVFQCVCEKQIDTLTFSYIH